MVSIALRNEFLNEFQQAKLGWTEVVIDNYIGLSEFHLKALENVRRENEISFHCVNLQIGNAAHFDYEYLNELKLLCNRFSPNSISDHISWGRANSIQSFDLLPIQYTENYLELLVAKIHELQDFFKRPWSFENPSRYFSIIEKNVEMSEADFFNLLCNKTGCKIILDLNNLYVTEFNFQNAKSKSDLSILIHRSS